MKKLLTFLIMLMVGMALFAMPIAGETDIISALNTVEAVSHSEVVLAAVTDVSPVIAQAENSLGNMNYFEVFAVNDNLFTVTNTDICLYRQEVNSLLGYSKTAFQKMFDNSRLTLEGWY